MSDLRPCSGCSRHVRARETACPFCAVALEPFEPRRVEGDERPMRSAVMLGVAVGAVAVSTALFGSACVLAYGAPSVDAGNDANVRDVGPTDGATGD